MNAAPSVAFRVDASHDIGNGHVMRCLTLAEALREKGAECLFLCREHPGHLNNLIMERGFAVAALAEINEPGIHESSELPAHSEWLGCDWQMDARESIKLLSSFAPDWMVVDHYALDHRWENEVKICCRRLLAIDDIADRPHSCDLLLDQNLGREGSDYSGLVPENCQLMIGPKYALLRPEFKRMREQSLKRRHSRSRLQRILVTMGGVDRENATGKILEALKSSELPQDCLVSVVMGPNAPWVSQVRQQAEQMPFSTEVLVNVSDMARRMAESDLAIGAAGSTSWERCCLGLPTLMVVLAENQMEIAEALSKKGAASLLGDVSGNDFPKQCADPITTLLYDTSKLQEMSLAAAEVTDGTGAQLVSDKVKEYGNHYSL